MGKFCWISWSLGAKDVEAFVVGLGRRKMLGFSSVSPSSGMKYLMCVCVCFE